MILVLQAGNPELFLSAEEGVNESLALYRLKKALNSGKHIALQINDWTLFDKENNPPPSPKAG